MPAEITSLLAWETLCLWEYAGKPMRQSWLPSLFHGDEPLVVALANEICALEIENERLRDEIVQLKTQMLGGSENDTCFIEGIDEGKALEQK